MHIYIRVDYPKAGQRLMQEVALYIIYIYILCTGTKIYSRFLSNQIAYMIVVTVFISISYELNGIPFG